MTNDLAALRADYLYRYGDTHPVCALVDRVRAAEAALAVAETHIANMRRVLLHYWGTTDPELLAEVWEDRAPLP